MSSAPQVLRQADALKGTISDSGKSITELWVTRQRLEDLYKKLLLMDLEYALDKKVEQDLWNHAFKNQINILQTQAKDKQNPKRGEIQASLNLFLETASGFYLQFLQLVCTTFKLDLPFRRKSSAFGVMKEKCQVKTKITPPKKSSCLYVCQHCLVHLGDIARYRQQVEQAQTYYRHAANLVPQNGQPYNQLAILEAARGNKLSTVFYYIRSLAVRHPFPVAATNLEKFYAKLTKDITELKGKLSMSEVVNAFLQFNALIHLSTDLTKAANLKERLMSSLPAHVTSQSFTSNILVQFTAITIFSLHHAQREMMGGNPKKTGEYSKDEEKCFELIFSFMICVLDVLLQYTPKQEQKAREFFTLPAVKVLLDWLSLNKIYVTKPIVTGSNIWGGFAKLLNIIQTVPDKENCPDLSKYEEVPLPEDADLRCFHPVEKAHSNYSFSRVPAEGLASHIETQLRCQRFVAHGKWLAEELSGLNLLNCVTLKSGRLQFTSPSVQNKALDAGGFPSERKTGRQNVAIQAIIQKQGQQDVGTDSRGTPVTQLVWSGDAGDSNNKGSSQSSSGQTSPKYLLGIPTTEPQFMKHGGTKTPANQSTYPRFSSPNSQQSPTFGGPINFVSPPRAGGNMAQQQISFGVRISGGMQGMQPHMPAGGQGHTPPGPQQAGSSPDIPQCQPFRMHTPITPYSQGDHFRLQTPRGNPHMGTNMSSPESQQIPLSAQQQIRAAMMRHPPPNQPFSNMTPQQILSAMKLSPQQQQQLLLGGQQQALSGQIQQQPGQQTAFPQAPGTERAQTSPKGQQQSLGQSVNVQGPRMPAFPAFSGAGNYPGTSGHGVAMGPSPFRHSTAVFNKEGQSQGSPNMFGGLSPLTIQPPKPSVIDTRLNTSFQGHAEGTPKPDGFYQDTREQEVVTKSSGPPASQPGVYSLFSSPSWAVPLSSGGDSKSLGSSPFSSAASSIRNSPEHVIESSPASSSALDLGLRFSVQDGHWGNQVPVPTTESQPPNTNSYLSSSIQSIWSSPGPTPLERLLEQQKQQRQNEPH